MSDSNPSETNEIVGKIHASGRQFVLAITGGGTRAISDLLTVPGGSRTVLEAIVPYSEAALLNLLRTKPEHFCSARTARLMAMAGFQKARDLAEPSPPGRGQGESAGNPLATATQHPHPGPLPKGEGGLLIGIGCTASLASDRPKRGAHRLFVAT